MAVERPERDFFLNIDDVGDADENAMGDGLEGMMGVRDVLGVLDVRDDGEVGRGRRRWQRKRGRGERAN